jgi:hypothetical protein
MFVMSLSGENNRFHIEKYDKKEPPKGRRFRRRTGV